MGKPAAAACAIATATVYVGNLSDRMSALEHTRCPACHAVLVTRQNYRVLDVRLVGGRCPDCRTAVAGLWPRRHAPRPRRPAADP